MPLYPPEAVGPKGRMSCPPLIARHTEAKKSNTAGVSLARHAVGPCPLSGEGWKKNAGCVDRWEGAFSSTRLSPREKRGLPPGRDAIDNLLCHAKDLTLWASLVVQTVYGGEHVMTRRRDAGHKQFVGIPSATGGIARLAYARAKQAGIALPQLLADSGLTVAQIEDRHARLKVKAQITFLGLVADALGDDLLDFTSRRASTFERSACSTM